MRLRHHGVGGLVRRKASGHHLIAAEVPAERSPRLRRYIWLTCLLLGFTLSTILAVRVVAPELATSERQAHYLAQLASELTFHTAPGLSPATRFPTAGPYNEQLGYTRLPVFLERLQANAYTIEAQARLSQRLQQLIDWGVFPIYHEKTQAGLRLLDQHGN